MLLVVRIRARAVLILTIVFTAVAAIIFAVVLVGVMLVAAVAVIVVEAEARTGSFTGLLILATTVVAVEGLVTLALCVLTRMVIGLVPTASVGVGLRLAHRL